jgi:phospholipase/lecithinase/hemolysin
MTESRSILPRPWRRMLASFGVALALLAGCGGDTTTVDPFVPQRLMFFGDETSLLVRDGADKGRRYGINGLNSDDVFDCRANPTWSQWLASTYGMLFEACPYDGNDDITAAPTATEFKAIQRAQLDHRAADLAGQVDAQLADTTASGGVTSQDMAAVMVGTHDIVEVYEALVDRAEYSRAGAQAELDRRGALVAAQVNRLAERGARVLITTVPRLDRTPYGRARIAASSAQANVLVALSDAFNARLRRNILQDGTKIGLVMADDLILAMTRSPTSYGLVTDGVTVPACSVTPLTACTADTLVSGAADRNNLWADDRHLGPVGHRQLGQLFTSRAINNPF